MKIIAAVDSKMGIAKQQTIPWYISDDLKNFKKLTANGTIIVGSKTYAQLPKPLKDRRIIVVSKHINYDNVTNISSLRSAIKAYPQAWVIGGAQIYVQALPFASELYITHIFHDYECDLFFPDFDKNFVLVSKSDILITDTIKYYYAHYKRK